MLSLLMRWLLLTLSVWLTTWIVPGIHADAWQSLLVAALVLAVLNAILRPVLVLLTLPMVVLSFGLFLLIINALLLKLTGFLVQGFHVDSFWAALGGSLIISLVSLLLNRGQRHGRAGASPLRRPRRGPPPGDGPVIDVTPR
jgi:putative membrane protein